MRRGWTRVFIFFFNAPATTEIYTLSLHDALPIFSRNCRIRAVVIEFTVRKPKAVDRFANSREARPCVVEPFVVKPTDPVENGSIGKKMGRKIKVRPEVAVCRVKVWVCVAVEVVLRFFIVRLKCICLFKGLSQQENAAVQAAAAQEI